MTIERREPSTTAAERESLEQWLEFHRATLEWKCDGLSPEQLRERSVPPSSLSLLGLVRHMAEVERSWFSSLLIGERPPSLYCGSDRDGDFNDVDEADPHEALATWRGECDKARAAIERFSLDDLSLGAEEERGRFNLRWIMVHMIEEYARHNGHADLLRERIDGAVGD